MSVVTHWPVRYTMLWQVVILCLLNTVAVQASPDLGLPADHAEPEWASDFQDLVALVGLKCSLFVDLLPCQDLDGQNFEDYVLPLDWGSRSREAAQSLENIGELTSQVVDRIFPSSGGLGLPREKWAEYVASLRGLDHLSRSANPLVQHTVLMVSEALMQKWLLAYYDRWVQQALFDEEMQRLAVAMSGLTAGLLWVAPGAKNGVNSVARAVSSGVLSRWGERYSRSRLQQISLSFANFRALWPLRWFSKKAAIFAAFLGGGAIWLREAEGGDIDMPPSPAHLVHFDYETRPGYDLECAAGGMDCDQVLADRRDRTVGEMFSGISGMLTTAAAVRGETNTVAGALGKVKTLARYSVLGIVVGIAVDWGVYRLWRWHEWSDSAAALRGAINRFIAANASAASSSEANSELVAEVYHTMNGLEVKALAEGEPAYRIQLKLLDVLLELEESQEGVPGQKRLELALGKLKVLRQEAQRVTETFAVEVNPLALTALIEGFQASLCWAAQGRLRLESQEGAEKSERCKIGQGRKPPEREWGAIVARMVSAVTTTNFNVFRQELAGVRALKGELAELRSKYSPSFERLKGEAQRESVSQVETMLERRIATLAEEETFLRQFIGVNNSQPNNGLEFAKRVRDILQAFGPQ